MSQMSNALDGAVRCFLVLGDDGRKKKATASESMFGGSGTTFAVGFFFSVRLAVAILSIKLFGTDLQTGSAIKLALGFLLFGAACFLSMSAATRTLSSLP